MRRLNIDTTFRLKFKYQPGQFQQIAKIIAEEQGLLGEIEIVEFKENYTIRDVTVETETDAQTDRITQRLRALHDIELLDVTDAIFKMHEGGKIHSASRVPINTVSDLRKVYTPGVSRVCLAIKANPSLAYDYTSLGNSVGIFTNGTRVLGLGNIGPVASLPVMEGKAALYDKFAGISATPILINTTNAEEFIRVVQQVSLSFGAIHLEDIQSPDCFQIEDELIKTLNKPVMHDDQHGTAVAALAAVVNACKLVNLPLEKAVLGQIGLGAAGAAIAQLAMEYGVKKVMVSDPNPAAVARLEQKGAQGVSYDHLMKNCDIVIAATGRAGLISPHDVRKGQILFALSNPNPEIEIQAALAQGAAFASDGRAINNALAFPGLFKGALLSKATSITPAMKLAAVHAIADQAAPGELVPDPLNPAVHAAVTAAVQAAAH